MDRIAFLEARRDGIGSSDVAKIVGLSEWGTALDVYLDKVEPVPVQLERMKPALEWGIRKEPLIAAAITDHYGWELLKIPTVIHRDHRFLLASVDRLTHANGANEVIEIKTASRADDWGEPETADVPSHYWLQVQHQMEVLHKTYEVEAAWVFVLIGSSDFRRYRIPRDPEYLGSVLPALEEFWRCVETRTPPEPDWQHEATLDAVRRLNQPKPGTTVELDADAKRLADEYDRINAEIKGLNELKDEMKGRMIAAMGEAEVGYLSDGRTINHKRIDRAGYTVQPTTYTDFRIRAPKKGSKSK